jgi:Endoplasmic Reticulum Oxidoreductin 1 (ERO1)
LTASGYKGEHAQRIWSVIYNQSCFDGLSLDAPESIQCREKRVFYRLVSGMHASIAAHLSADYLLDEDQVPELL